MSNIYGIVMKRSILQKEYVNLPHKSFMRSTPVLQSLQSCIILSPLKQPDKLDHLSQASFLRLVYLTNEYFKGPCLRSGTTTINSVTTLSTKGLFATLSI